MNYVRAVLNWQTLLAAFFILLPTMLGFYQGDRGKFIVASYKMHDRLFEGTVLYLFDHKWYEARGLVLNHPYEDYSLLPAYLKEAGVSVFWGGPVQDSGLSGIGTDPAEHDAAVSVLLLCNEKISHAIFDEMVELSPDVLEKAKSQPECYRIYVGYAGWEMAQLEKEKSEGYWLSAPFDLTLLRNTEIKFLRDAVLPLTEDKFSPMPKLK